MELTTDSEELMDELDEDPVEDLDEDEALKSAWDLLDDPKEDSALKSAWDPADDPDENADEDSDEDLNEAPLEDLNEDPAEDLNEDPVDDSDDDPNEDSVDDSDEDSKEDFDEDPKKDRAKDPKKDRAKEPKKDRAKEPKKDPDDDEDDDDDEDPDESDEGGRGLNLFTLIILLIAIGVTAIYYTCTVRTVHVSGNSLYTSEEIARYVISDDTQLRHNAVFLTALYLTPLAPKIPFEERVSVALESYDTIRITVKDMELTAFVPYGGKNLYFSENGVVQEISPLTVKGTTFVTGLTIMKAEKGKEIESENSTGLESVLDVLQILSKYEMKADCIVLGKTGNVTFYLGRVKIQLGRNDFDLKISKIAQIYPYLQGRKGTIDMTNYSSSDENIILK